MPKTQTIPAEFVMTGKCTSQAAGLMAAAVCTVNATQYRGFPPRSLLLSGLQPNNGQGNYRAEFCDATQFDDVDSDDESEFNDFPAGEWTTATGSN